MVQAILIVLLLLASGSLFYIAKSYVNDRSKPLKKWMINAAGGSLGAFALALFIGLSVVYVDKDEIVLLDKVYFGSSMPTGQIIASSNQNGPQAEVLNPGFKFIPFVRFEYDLATASVITIPDNKYGVVTARDGEALRDGQVIADAWDSPENMINAENFLAKGGQKGMQLTVLKPGQYRINPSVFRVTLGDALQVKTGEVAVIRSNVTEKDKVCVTEVTATGLTTALVPKGCKGVWNEPLMQGMYFLNANAYKSTIISTRAQVWAYKGGYTTKKINLTVNDDGSITQSTESITVDVPVNAADKAINVRSEGWTVPVEARVTVQVSPEDAPRVVAGVGSLQNVEDKITTPNIRDSLRTIGGRSKSGCNSKGAHCKDNGARVLDFVNKRKEISDKVLADIKPSTEQAGVTILDVNLGEPAIPPELLLANQREQLATQLQKTFKAERETQKERIKTQREKATADQQPQLVAAEIDRKASLERMQTRENDGMGERKYMQELAKGEKARKDVLGEDSVVFLKALEIIAEHPELVKVPTTLVNNGSGEGSGSLEGMAAVFGGFSNISKIVPAPVAK